MITCKILGLMCIAAETWVKLLCSGECVTSGAPENKVMRLNDDSGNSLNIVKTANFSQHGNVTRFEYYAIRTVSHDTYLSFWRQDRGTVGIDFTLIGKIQFRAYKGYHIYVVPPELQLSVNRGDMIGVHYGLNSSRGTISYETKYRNFTDGITISDLHDVAILNVQDDDWQINKVIAISGTTKKGVALRVYTECYDKANSKLKSDSNTNPCHCCVGLGVAVGAISILLVLTFAAFMHMQRKNKQMSEELKSNIKLDTTRHSEPQYEELARP